MKNENSKKVGFVVIAIIILAAVFYGGDVYGKNRAPQRGARGANAQFAGNLGMGGRGNFAGFTSGKVLSKDDKSITVQTMGGGSRIIFLDADTKVLKSITGSMNDLAVGTQVTVMGAANTDGSVNATTVQIRPQTVK
jgi:hypothetical protein